VAGLTVLTVVLSCVALFRPLADQASPARQPVRPRISITPLGGKEGNSLLHDQATLFDPTPLFLPTELNTNQGPLPAEILRQPGQVFTDFEAQLTYSRPELELPGESAASTPQRPVDLLKAPSNDPFLGFGRVDGLGTPLNSRTGVVEVREVGTGNLVLKQVLGSEVTIPAGGPDWQPAEFLVAVTAEGFLGRPMETASSDLEDVDVFFRDYLAKTLRLGERLGPGMYCVLVGP